MGSMFHSDNSGAFVLLAGMIALVMFGVVVTLLMDGSLALNEGGDIQGALRSQEHALEDWKERKKSLLAEKEEFARLRAAAREREVVRKQLAEATVSLTALQAEVSAGESALEELATAYDDYRSRHTAEVRRLATGVELGDVTTSDGKVLRNATVRVLTQTEMRVVHEGGPATIPVTELPPEVRARFHLDVEEATRLVRERKERALARLRALAAKREQERLAEEERVRKEAAARPRRVSSRSSSRTADLTDEERAQLRTLRSEVSLLYVNMGALRRELAGARSQLGGPDRSPPGSLQTWEQRVEQLSRRETKGWSVIRAKEEELLRLDPTYRRPPLATVNP